MSGNDELWLILTVQTYQQQQMWWYGVTELRWMGHSSVSTLWCWYSNPLERRPTRVWKHSITSRQIRICTLSRSDCHCWSSHIATKQFTCLCKDTFIFQTCFTATPYRISSSEWQNWRLCMEKAIEVAWYIDLVPWHAGAEGNEMADSMAQWGTLSGQSDVSIDF